MPVVGRKTSVPSFSSGMYNTTVLVDEPVSADMDHLRCYIINEHRATGCRMNVTGRRVAGIDIVHRWKPLTVLDRLSDLVRRPTALQHLVVRLLGGMISTKLPTWAAIHSSNSLPYNKLCLRCRRQRHWWS